MSEKKASKRFNLKLPYHARSQFMEPFDDYLGYLLQLTSNLTAFDPNLCREDAPVPCSGSNRWTLWVSKEIRQQFDKQKAILAPLRTHGAFIELLLAYRNYLEQQGTLPVFTHSKTSHHRSSTSHPYYSQQSVARIPSYSQQWPVQHSSSIPNMFPITHVKQEQYPEMNYMYFVDDRLDSAIPKTVHPLDTFLSQESVFPSINTSFNNVPQSPSDSSATRQRDEDVQERTSKKLRINTMDSPSFISPYLASPFSANFYGINNGIENLKLDFRSNETLEGDLASPDVLKATQLDFYDAQKPPRPYPLNNDEETAIDLPFVFYPNGADLTNEVI
ncbi:hypothetical protein HK103_005200 [Boothiomyces macroporosus]|uniref:Uncharacterized protein n=1 Tax=Boothiomyces macroporosus TaxID=261099 RepID=A0AAD5UIH1_9FUNG|nr:hypothetical protein HK103_005200 [Boothiomyces macroporosus]